MSQLESAPPDEASSPPTEKERLPHSKWGIISYRLAIYALLVWFLSAPILMLLGLIVPGSVMMNVLSIFSIISWGCVLAFCAAFVLGICGLCQPHTKKGNRSRFTLRVLVRCSGVATHQQRLAERIRHFFQSERTWTTRNIYPKITLWNSA